jgi:hypothetical protein
MSNDNTDAFGQKEPVMGNQVGSEHEDMFARGDDFFDDPNTPPLIEGMENEKPKRDESFFSRKGFLGLPNGALIAVGMLIFFVVFTVILLVVKRGSRPAPQPVPQAVSAPAEQNQLVLELSSIRDQLGQVRAVVDKITVDNANFKAAVEAKLANQEVSALSEQVQTLGKLTDATAAAVQALNKKIVNSRPLADSLAKNSSARLISIGNGMARIRDEYGEEFSLHKGDRWDGSTVSAIRSDLGRVVLSNGSVIE